METEKKFGVSFWIKLVITLLSAFAASIGASAMVTHCGMVNDVAQAIAFGTTAAFGGIIMSV
jgi:hypothetical protein